MFVTKPVWRHFLLCMRTQHTPCMVINCWITSSLQTTLPLLIFVTLCKVYIWDIRRIDGIKHVNDLLHIHPHFLSVLLLDIKMIVLLGFLKYKNIPKLSLIHFREGDHSNCNSNNQGVGLLLVHLFYSLISFQLTLAYWPSTYEKLTHRWYWNIFWALCQYRSR